MGASAAFPISAAFSRLTARLLIPVEAAHRNEMMSPPVTE